MPNFDSNPINWNKIPRNETINSKLPKSIRLEMHLSEHYDITFNTATQEVYIFSKKQKREINIHELIRQLRNAELSTGENWLYDLFRSEFTPKVNPISDFFNSLSGKWNEGDPDYINELADCVKPFNFDDGDFDYTLRWQQLFKKWLVACLACWLHGIPNEVILILISENLQGVGKTRFTRFLSEIPGNILRHKLTKDIRDMKELPILATLYSFIVYDELIGMKNPMDVDIFKSTISNPLVEIRRGRKIEAVRQIANFLGSIDRKEFLFDTAGSRRFGLCQVADINLEKMYTLDLLKIYAQALALLKISMTAPDVYNFRFGKTDFLNFERYNNRFFKSNNLQFWISQIYEPCYEEAEGEYMQSQTIARNLIQNGLPEALKKDLSPDRLGHVLKAMKFQHFTEGKRIKGVNYIVKSCYLVKLLNS